jgi:hypothetical protein
MIECVPSAPTTTSPLARCPLAKTAGVEQHALQIGSRHGLRALADGADQRLEAEARQWLAALREIAHVLHGPAERAQRRAQVEPVEHLEPFDQSETPAPAGASTGARSYTSTP